MIEKRPKKNIWVLFKIVDYKADANGFFSILDLYIKLFQTDFIENNVCLSVTISRKSRKNKRQYNELQFFW